MKTYLLVHGTKFAVACLDNNLFCNITNRTQKENYVSCLTKVKYQLKGTLQKRIEQNTIKVTDPAPVMVHKWALNQFNLIFL